MSCVRATVASSTSPAGRVGRNTPSAELDAMRFPSMDARVSAAVWRGSSGDEGATTGRRALPTRRSDLLHASVSGPEDARARLCGVAIRAWRAGRTSEEPHGVSVPSTAAPTWCGRRPVERGSSIGRQGASTNATSRPRGLCETLLTEARRTPRRSAAPPTAAPGLRGTTRCMPDRGGATGRDRALR